MRWKENISGWFRLELVALGVIFIYLLYLLLLFIIFAVLTFEANANDHMQCLLSFSLGSHLLLTTTCLACLVV